MVVRAGIFLHAALYTPPSAPAAKPHIQILSHAI